MAMKEGLVAEILELPVEERVRLVEAIWDSISAVPDAIPLTEWQREELDRRLAEYEANPNSGRTMQEVFSSLRK
jgi:putative addiction module component (TIGR02574 family)